MSVIPGVDGTRGLEFSKPAGVPPTTLGMLSTANIKLQRGGFFLCCGTGMEPRASCALGKCSTMSAASSPSFSFTMAFSFHTCTEGTVFSQTDLGSTFGAWAALAGQWPSSQAFHGLRFLVGETHSWMSYLTTQSWQHPITHILPTRNRKDELHREREHLKRRGLTDTRPRNYHVTEAYGWW